MKRILIFSRYFIPAAIVSVIFITLGVLGFFRMGFNLGIDFQPGLLQEVQFAPTALNLTYEGPGNANIILSRNAIEIVISGAVVDEVTHTFPFSQYTTQGALAQGFRAIEGLSIEQVAAASIQTTWFLQSAQSSPRLDAQNPFRIHYLPPNAAPVDIADVRASLLPLGNASVQVLGTPAERRYMIRMEDGNFGIGGGGELVVSALEDRFGQGEVAVTRSDFVGARFAQQLADQAMLLLGATLLLILGYCTFRFKFQYALGAVIAILHNALIMVTFIVWSRMEFNTTTIAAILTVLGYSINDTVVVFDRMKETRRIYPDDPFVDVINRALSETLSRTIITTVSTMLAVASLYIFTSGSMQDFAAALMVGMATGVYATIFIAMGFVYLWEIQTQKKVRRRYEEVSA